MAVPTLVQSVSSGMEHNGTYSGVTTFTITFPNVSLANNLLVFGFQMHSGGTVTSVKDDTGTDWTSATSGTNATSTQKAFVYYRPNAAAGLKSVQVVVAGLDAVPPTDVTSKINGWFQEWYNIATSTPLDVVINTAIATPSKSAGSFSPTAGDLLIHWGMDLADTGNFNGTSITPGTGFTLNTADLQVGVCVQSRVAPGGAINPAFTTAGGAAGAWGSLAVSFTSAAAGTAPGSGMRIQNVYHVLTSSIDQSRTTAPLVLQFPSSGNLLVGQFISGDGYITGVTDSASNTWVCPSGMTAPGPSGGFAQIVYAGNATTSSTLGSITLTLSAALTGNDVLVLYDVVNAATAPLANAAIKSENQADIANLSSVTISPITANGLVFACLAPTANSITGLVGASFINDTVVNGYNDTGSGGTLPSSLDEDGGFGHVYNSDLTPLTFVWTYNSAKVGLAVGDWAAAAAAFNAAGQVNTAPVILQGPIHGEALSGSTCAAAFPKNTTTGNTLLYISNHYSGTFRTISSTAISAGAATFASVQTQAGSAGHYGPLEAQAAPNITGGTTPTITVTYSGANTFVDLMIYELMNVPTTVQKDGGSGKAGTAATACTAPAITTTNARDIIFAAFAPSDSMTLGGAAWSSAIAPTNNALMESIGVGAIQTGLAPDATQSSSATYGAIVFALKGAVVTVPPAIAVNPPIMFP